MHYTYTTKIVLNIIFKSQLKEHYKHYRILNLTFLNYLISILNLRALMIAIY